MKTLTARIVRLVSVPRDNPDLLKAQFEVFSSQVPLMYSIVLINAWALAITFIPVAPAWLTIHVPLGFTAICGFRLAGWWRARHSCPSAEAAHTALTRTNLFGFILTVALTAWALSLYPYGDPYLQGNVAFFIGITGVGVIICLLQLKSAAFMVAIIINVSFVAFFGASGISSFGVMAVNMLLVAIALLMVVTVQFRHFASAVEARTKLEAANRENFRLANLDSLTGLSNRRQFFSHLEAAFAQSPGKHIAIGVIDLDGFKPVNDLYGHAVGDSLLVQVGQRLAALSCANTHVSRLGGDEFALTIIDCPDDAGLLALGEEICARLREPFVLAEATVQISGSIGFSVFPHLASNAHELYERADYALYQSKRAHRGHPLLFSRDHIIEIEQSDRIERLLCNADLDQEMAVFFQPIIDIRLERTVAFEALARWTSPVLGPVPPDSFIPVAERAGLVSQITRVLLRKALAVARDWPQEVRLSFNLSTHDISSPDGATAILGIVLSSGVDPRRIDFEITETAMMYDFKQATASITVFKKLGCGIALDDFGTGYSSLSRLHALPLTKIKIDRGFVSGLDNNPASYKIVKSLLALSADMDLDCVVEGVETAAELAILDKLGGRLVQGYIYSRPLPQTEIAAFMRAASPIRASV